MAIILDKKHIPVTVLCLAGIFTLNAVLIMSQRHIDNKVDQYEEEHIERIVKACQRPELLEAPSIIKWKG